MRAHPLERGMKRPGFRAFARGQFRHLQLGQQGPRKTRQGNHGPSADPATVTYSWERGPMKIGSETPIEDSIIKLC